jgi:uncharacterized protein (DUF1015 family)
MMTFINMHSPGVKILATHRLVSGVDTANFLKNAAEHFEIQEIDSLDKLQSAWRTSGNRSVIGVAMGQGLWLLTDRNARGELDVKVLHERLLDKALGIGEDAVRDEKHLRYMRGLDGAVEQVRKGAAQIAFLLKPTSIQQVADTSFAGGVMPQKSTDFYPKVLSGLTIYKLD